MLGVGLGCGPEDDAEACVDGPQSVVLGRPQPFVALADGDAVELVHGVQGGYHINLAVELRGLGDEVFVELFGTIDGERLAEDTATITTACVDGRVVDEALRLVWAATPDELDGATAIVELRATARDGRSGSATVALVIDDPLR